MVREKERGQLRRVGFLMKMSAFIPHGLLVLRMGAEVTCHAGPFKGTLNKLIPVCVCVCLVHVSSRASEYAQVIPALKEVSLV